MTAWDPQQPSTEAEDSFVSGALTVEPFTALAPHYGMLLGVSDFQVMGANPRGKLRLHQAWQHGPGVVWGLGVKVSADERSLVVCPGLAVDCVGREVPVSAEMCLDVHAWVKEKSGEGEPFPSGLDEYVFSARLWLEHDACPTRKVPSVRSTCAQADDSVQYSRVHEFGHLELEAYQPAVEHCRRADEDEPEEDCDNRDDTFADLRALVRNGDLPDLPRQPAGWLDAFRAVAALETARHGCEQCGKASASPFPACGSPRLLLADLPKVVLRRHGDTWTVTAEVIDLSVRRTHLSTWLIEELIAESLAGSRGSEPVADAGGPRVARVRRSARQIVVELTADVLEATVADAVEVRWIDRSAAEPAWSEPMDIEPRTTRATEDRAARIVLPVWKDQDTDIWHRVVLRGTGPTPLMGLSHGVPVPLAGRVGGPPCTADDGCDVAAMIRAGVER